MAQVATGTAVHDVVVIGSGAGGGTATKVLADLGVTVLLLEAGPMLNMADLKEHMWPYNVPHRGAGAKGQAYTGGPTGFTYSATYGGAQLEGEPYTVAPGSDFSWFRSRVLGGRTNHYGRVTLRMSDYDFKPRSTDGLGWDWPISYDDLAPFYEKAERFIGVVGSAEGIRSAPDGIFHTPAPLRAHDVLVQRACAKQGIRAVSARQAVITHPVNGRPACHYCGQCGRGCMTASNYAASYVQIFPAMQTGRVKVIANAMARELITDETGKVTAVSYVDKTNGSEQQVRCRTVVLAASACESARLLLNSKSPRHPQGLANGSGKVGRYLMDTVGSSASAMIPALSGMPHYNSDGYGSHLYVPWWLWDKHKTLNFPRGYHIEVGGGYGMPGVGSFTGDREPDRRLRRQDEAGDSRRVRHVGRLVRPRRDDPQRAVLLRDRSRGQGSVGHPGAPVPLGVERSRAEPGPPHADDLPRHPRGDGRPDRRASRRRTRPRRTRRRADDGNGTDAPAGSRRRRPARRVRRPASRTRRPVSRRRRAGSGRARRPPHPPTSTDLPRRRDHPRSGHACAWATIRRRACSTSTVRRTR